MRVVSGMTAAAIARCPVTSLLAGHYREDGTCLCDVAPSLFAAAEAARDEALERVEANASIDWLLEAERTIILVPRGVEFTTDLVWERLAARDDVDTHEPRALGPVMRRLALAGEVRKTGAYRPSARRECHARPIPVWRRVQGRTTDGGDTIG